MRVIRGISGALLFVFCFVFLLFFSLQREIWADEITTITEVHDYSFTHLLYNGPTYELNTSPLHYLLGKSWLALQSQSPQLHWNLQIFFRVLPSLWWSLAVLAVFLALAHYAQKWLRPWASLPLALSLSIFFFANPFVLYQVVQDRPYALWLSLSTVHLIGFLALLESQSRAKLLLFATTSILLVWTAYVALLQVILACAILGLHAPSVRIRKHQLLLAIASACLGLWYFSRVIPSPPLPMHTGSFSAVLDMLAISLQAYPKSIFLDVQLVDVWKSITLIERLTCLTILFLPLALWRSPRARASLLLIYGMLLACILIALVLILRNQVLSGPRYLIFLYPYLFTSLLLSLFVLTKKTSILLRSWGAAALALACCFGLGHTLTADVQAFLRERPLSMHDILIRKEARSSCPANLDRFRDEFQRILPAPLASLCR